jgi:hypothetical protein
MNRSFLFLLPLLGSLVLSACGAKAGDKCQGNDYTCSSEKESLECRDHAWRALPCRGPAGCTEQDQTVRCDLTGNVEGDACAASAEGRGLCTADGKAVLECRMGKLVQVKTCGTCTMDSARVTCQP